MSPEDQKILAIFGQMFIAGATNTIIVYFTYGVLLLETSILVHFLMNRPKGKANYLMIVYTGLIFVTFTWEICIRIVRFLNLPNCTRVEELDGNLEAQLEQTNDKTLSWRHMGTWVTRLVILWGNCASPSCIVAWRAWFIFRHSRIWKIIILILVVANIGINIAGSILENLEITKSSVEAFDHLNWLLTSVLSLAVHWFATALIGWKAWCHHKTHSEASVHHHSLALRTMLLLIKSGAIFCVIQAVNCLFQLVSLEPNASDSYSFQVASTVVECIWYSASALYPISVFILTQTHNSPVAETLISVQLTETHRDRESDHTSTGTMDSLVPLSPMHAEEERGDSCSFT
ncbi:hypothetical protein D9757_001588 [Collybiopsis confluens]|uniref:Uncharacterized protein n=1 Tax=Collybiopsis confluens TaxID=2823264 RepID=A0A8H5MG09_9AGAR|nr:hypothetical protein D9757_001588 [Collybiopsis confluens]